MHVPFPENDPGVLSDGELDETRPGPERHRPVCRAKAIGIGIRCNNELSGPLVPFHLGQNVQCLSVRGNKLRSSGQTSSWIAGRSSIEESVIVADDGEQVTNEVDGSPFTTRCGSIPFDAGGDPFNSSDACVIGGKNGLDFVLVIPSM